MVVDLTGLSAQGEDTPSVEALRIALRVVVSSSRDLVQRNLKELPSATFDPTPRVRTIRKIARRRLPEPGSAGEANRLCCLAHQLRIAHAALVKEFVVLRLKELADRFRPEDYFNPPASSVRARAWVHHVTPVVRRMSPAVTHELAFLVKTLQQVTAIFESHKYVRQDFGLQRYISPVTGPDARRPGSELVQSLQLLGQSGLVDFLAVFGNVVDDSATVVASVIAGDSVVFVVHAGYLCNDDQPFSFAQWHPCD